MQGVSSLKLMKSMGMEIGNTTGGVALIPLNTATILYTSSS